MKRNKITVLFLIFIFSLSLSYCKKKYQEDNENKNIDRLPKINGFYFFKKDMSYEEVLDVLKSNNIKFKNIDLTKTDEITSAYFYHHLLFSEEYKFFKNIKLIEGYNLSILNSNLKRFQICFYNNKIFYFIYQDNFELDYNQNTETNQDLSFRNTLNLNLNLLSTFSEGLKYKYGAPNLNVGDFDSNISPITSDDTWNNSTSKGAQYTQKEVWFTKDSILHIELENFYKKDTFYKTNHLIKTQILSEIKVLFDSNFAKLFEKLSEKRDSLNRIKIENVTRKRNDSIRQEKKRQFNKL